MEFDAGLTRNKKRANAMKIRFVFFLMITLLLTCNLVFANDTNDMIQQTEEDSMKSDTPLVGAYYYPWCRGSEYQWRQSMRLLLTERQEPKVGIYDSQNPEVIAEHIDQSLRAGISFWGVSWWGPGSLTDQVFKRSVLAHPDSSKLKYAMLYESTGRFGSFENPSYDNWIRDLEYLKENYFDDPRYLRIDDRPVLFIYLSREYFRDKGHEALSQMREKFPEIYLVGDDVFFADSEGSYNAEWAKNFDAVTAYDVYGQSLRPLGGTHEAIEALARNYRQAKEAANSVGTAFIPAVAPGYNDRAVREGHPGRARYFTDVEDSEEGDIFREMIRQAALPTIDSAADNIIMVTSFNEWWEDTQIEATAGTAAPSKTDESESGTFYTGGQKYVDYGYLYLDILKEEVFRDKSQVCSK